MARLIAEGYEAKMVGDYLVIFNVPYVNCSVEVRHGILASQLKYPGTADLTARDHTAYWIGEYPCDREGNRLERMVNQSGITHAIADGMVASIRFSQKPKGGYANHYEKITTYVGLLAGEARVLDPAGASAAPAAGSESARDHLFIYHNTSLSRYGIDDVDMGLRDERVAIVGLGGTGSYVLDLVAKTRAREMHLFDGDRMLCHNSYRTPGAFPAEALQECPYKVDALAGVYSRMRRGIVPHREYIAESNVEQLGPMTFVFLCVDNGKARNMIVDYLVRSGIPFVSSGIGMLRGDGALLGVAGVTACVPPSADHVPKHVTMGDPSDDDPYSTNIQIAEINALSAALAVIKWKKIRGFYRDTRRELSASYMLERNALISDGEYHGTDGQG